MIERGVLKCQSGEGLLLQLLRTELRKLQSKKLVFGTTFNLLRYHLHANTLDSSPVPNGYQWSLVEPVTDLILKIYFPTFLTSLSNLLDLMFIHPKDDVAFI